MLVFNEDVTAMSTFISTSLMEGLNQRRSYTAGGSNCTTNLGT